MAKVYTKPGSFSAATKAALKTALSIIKVAYGTVVENIAPTGLAQNAVDFQLTRGTAADTASAVGSFIAGGAQNKIANVVERDSNANYSHAEGIGCQVLDFYGHAEGANTRADGKIAHAEGNASICSGNDSHAEGNRTVTGRRYYNSITSGSEDAGDSLGVLQFVVIPDTYGDASSYFPNALFTDITTRYGTGAQKDDKGNVYPTGMTPAVWTGDVPTTVNDLKWALHSICILKGSSESQIAFANIKKVVYTGGSGTKVYYAGAKPYTTIAGIYSSYAPTVVVGGIQAGNGMHSEGIFTSAVGYGAHAEGNYTKAWNLYAHAEGNTTEANGQSSHAQGILTKANGIASDAIGSESVAKRNYQQSYAVGKRLVAGDSQVIKMAYRKLAVNVGWHEIYLLETIEDGKGYNFETMVFGRQTAGTAGAVGDTFAYKFTGCFVVNAGVSTVVGTPTRTLIGRSAGMAGDGLTTGVRMSWKVPNDTVHRAELRMDGLADTTFEVNTYSVIQEISIL